MSQVGPDAGPTSSLCQFQGFLIQMCVYLLSTPFLLPPASSPSNPVHPLRLLSFSCYFPSSSPLLLSINPLTQARFCPADAMWNLSMAINVYLTVFRKYNSTQLKSLEWIYLLVNYGATSLVALILCFISSEVRGKVYGNAILWCWVRIEWDFLRILVFYAPVWTCIIITFVIYVMAGHHIFRKRRALRAFTGRSQSTGATTKASVPPLVSPMAISVINPFASFKTTEVQITSEPASTSSPTRNASQASHRTGTYGTSAAYQQYSVTIERNTEPVAVPPPPTPGAVPSHRMRQVNAAMDANTAAWGYTKCALLFFVSLLITWVPSSINRVYALVYPHSANFPLNFAAGLVLPLMGFWNAVIYFFTSWGVVKERWGAFRRGTSSIVPIRPGNCKTRDWDSPRKAQYDLEDSASLTGGRRESADGAKSEGSLQSPV